MKPFAALAATFGAAMLAGCSSLLAPQPDLTRFFVLSSVTGAAAQPPADSEQDPTIGVGPVRFPDYLGRTQIVTRVGANRLQISDIDHWAEPLDRNFVAVLAKNLGARLETERIVTHPWYVTVPLDFEIPIEVLHFESDDRGNARLAARWGIKDGRRDEVLFVTQSDIVEPAATPGSEGGVAALSVAVDKLSAEIAAAIQSVRKPAQGN